MTDEPDKSARRVPLYSVEDGVRDVAGLAGLGMLGYGLWMRDPSLALIWVGGLLFGCVALMTVLGHLGLGRNAGGGPGG